MAQRGPPIALAVYWLCACGGAQRAHVPAPATNRGVEPGTPSQSVRHEPAPPPTAVAPLPPPAPPRVLVTDPATLRALSDSGLTFGERVLGRRGASLAELTQTPRLRTIERALERDLARTRKGDARAGVGMRHVHRLFDLRWLRSPHTRFELVAVVNRADRAVFAPEHCGETRLVYRLAYATEVTRSRLPMTINVVYFQPRTSDPEAPCLDAARRWQLAAEGAALATALRADGGPLGDELLSGGLLKSIETNVQTVRWPSTIRPDMAGHAEYALRVFVPNGEGLREAPLENTPRARLSSAERAELLRWVGENLPAIDAGTARMPERFAATVSTSVTPLGLGRPQNRPFGRLLSASDLGTLELGGFTHIASPEALRRRLDGMACAGCHQTRSAAGFHLLGEPTDASQRLDALQVPGSPHLLGELPRRREFVATVARGEAPDPARPHSDHEPGFGGWGTHCGLGDPGFASWTCAPGLRCAELGDPVVGTCVTDGAALAGDPCEVGHLRPHDDPRRDRVRGLELSSCSAGACNDNRVGFPHGMCGKACDALGDGETCGAIVSLRPFNDCIARGDPFGDCITSAAFPTGMRACNADHPCRDDYLCARGSGDGGVCIPPYFLFQLRVDGHVVPP